MSPEPEGPPGPRRFAITGASGLVGRSLGVALESAGHPVLRLVRGAAGPGRAAWDPERGALDTAPLEGIDAVVHLAGESIAGGRLTAERRARIHGSRVRGTDLLARGLAGLACRPAVLISASAVGWYGDRGDEALDEDSGPGSGFLAQVCHEWEAATRPAEEAGIRVVHLRLGIVLDARGGALAKMLPIFRAGLGGRLGSGRQWVSWIAMPDLIAVIRHVTVTPSLSGPVCAVAPGIVTNAELTAALARALRRPAVLPAPAFALRAVLGALADETLLASQRVHPTRLLESGFSFGLPALEPALAAVLADPAP